MKKWISGLLFLALIVAIVLYAAGAFSGEQVEPHALRAPGDLEPPARQSTATRVDVPVYEDAIGTVESRTRVEVAAQVTARVTAVYAEAGEEVEAKKPLVDLDAREVGARYEQAREALKQAEAAKVLAVHAKARAEALLGPAEARSERVRGLLEARVASPEQLEDAEANHLRALADVAGTDAAIAAAEAQIQQAMQVVTAAKVAVGHTAITVPISGVIASRQVEPGDLAWPGRTLLEVLDPNELRLQAEIREGLITRISRGQEFDIQIPAADVVIQGTVAEVCPTADPRSRTFRTRVNFDTTPGIRPGMFGRLRIPVGTRSVVSLPAEAVMRAGQLESVHVKVGEVWTRRLVTTGRAIGDGWIEILSGVASGEIVGLPEAD